MHEDEQPLLTLHEQRRGLRRWCRAAVVLGVVAAAAGAARGVPAATRAGAVTVDRTLQCTNLNHVTGSAFFDATSTPTGEPPRDANGKLRKPPSGFEPVPGILLDTGSTLSLLTLSSAATGYKLDRIRCAPAKASLALTSHRLPHAMTLSAADRATFHVRCAVPRMLFRIRIVNDSSGVPLRAQLLVVKLQGRRPLVYVSWSREHMTAFAAPACVAMQ